MFIIKCDRCGKEKVVNNMLPMFDKNENQQDSKTHYIISSIKDGKSRCIILCDECENDFEKFLNVDSIETKNYTGRCFIGEDSEHMRGV